MQLDFQKKLAAGLSIFSNTTIIVLKLIAGFISGSISIISEAVHSFSDLLASILAFLAVSKSSKPADSNHPFGHGKYEDLAGFVEGFLIMLAAVYIVFEATKKLLFDHHLHFDSELGIWVMAISVIANIIVSKYLFYVAEKTNSIALFADGEHLRTDVYSSLGVLIGLIVIKITGLTILDPIIAIIVAVIIFKAGISVSKITMNNLLDASLPKEELEKIEKILHSFSKIQGFKELKTRRVGPSKALEVTILFEKDLTLFVCHSICDEIESELTRQLGDITILIRPEPKNP